MQGGGAGLEVVAGDGQGAQRAAWGEGGRVVHIGGDAAGAFEEAAVDLQGGEAGQRAAAELGGASGLGVAGTKAEGAGGDGDGTGVGEGGLNGGRTGGGGLGERAGISEAGG